MHVTADETDFGVLFKMIGCDLMDTKVKTGTAVPAGQQSEVEVKTDVKSSAKESKTKSANYNMNLKIPRS